MATPDKKAQVQKQGTRRKSLGVIAPLSDKEIEALVTITEADIAAINAAIDPSLRELLNAQPKRTAE